MTNGTTPEESEINSVPAEARLIAAMIAADGVVDERELEAAKTSVRKLGHTDKTLIDALKAIGPDPFDIFAKTLSEVTRERRGEVATELFDLAEVDDRLDRREAALLSAMQEAWGVDVDFVNKPIEWDEDQQLIVEARRDDRVLVSAGPGMGKTAVACARVGHLINREHCSDANIWVVSFTRAAVTEVRTRIADFCEDEDNAFAVKIATIDSQAWRVRYGFSDAEADKLFGGFETGIERALALLEAPPDAVRDWFADLEHVIIDEAQDVTGVRAQFLLALIDLLPSHCGLTVFHDPAQAIYDYAHKEEKGFRFTDGLKKNLGESLQEFSLKQIYRTEDPTLLRLYEDLRLDILGQTNITTKEFTARADLVKDAAASVGGKRFDGSEILEHPTALVLFRRRIEVAQASAFLCNEARPHRLRMSNLPRGLHPWIALTFSNRLERNIDRVQFEELHDSAVSRFGAVMDGDDPEKRWELVSRYGAGKRNTIDLLRLRDSLSSNPPDELLLHEVGREGPILGTIHASKGREADDVFLQINDGWASSDRNGAADFAEESRVLFVGATRARRSLRVGGGYDLKFASSTESGRAYRQTRKNKNGVQFQIGLIGDFDEASAASNQADIKKLVGQPLPIRCGGPLEPGDWVYRLTTETGEMIGATSQRVSGDMMEIAKTAGCGRRSAAKLSNVFVLGWATACAPSGEEIGAGSGFWVIPQIAGLTTVYLQW